MKKFKILIPVLGFGSSGGMRVLSQLASYFIKAGHATEFLAPNDGVEPYFPTAASVRRYDYPFKRIPAIRFYAKMICMCLWLSRHSMMYDAVIANAYGTALPVYLGTRKKASGFYYIQAYEVDFAKDVPYPFKWIDLLLASRSYRLDLVRIVNSNLYINYKEIESDYVVPPGIDFGVFKFEPKIWTEAPLHIGCIGRLEGWKGTQLVIDTVREFRRMTGLDIRLNVAFNLPRDFIRSESDNFINLLKPHGDVELSKFYRQNHLFVAIGLIQSGAYHYPCMESMASGTLVISNYGPLETEDPLFLKNVNMTTLTNAISNFLNMGEAERSNLRQKHLADVSLFSWEKVSGSFLDVFIKNI